MNTYSLYPLARKGKKKNYRNIKKSLIIKKKKSQLNWSRALFHLTATTHYFKYMKKSTSFNG